MSNSLKDQLMGLGFKPAPAAPKPPRPSPPQGAAKGGNSGAGRQAKDAGKAGKHRHIATGKGADTLRTREEMDLAKAYALRNEHEKRERERIEREKQELARQRREAKQKLESFLATQTTLNATDTDQVRHFEYGGKIKRIHVTAEQLAALNRGELGVLQVNGRYLLVTAAVLSQAKAIFSDAVALEVDPNAPQPEVAPQAGDAADGYDDPKYRIPDDLIW